MKSALLLGAFVVGAPVMAGAQNVSLFIGGVSASYADSVSGSAGVVGGRLRLASGAGAGVVDGSLARFATGEWAAQLGTQAIAAWAPDAADALGVELGGSLNTLQGGIWSTTVAAGPFLARHVGPLTASLAVAVGGARSVSATTLLLRSLTLGARYEEGPWRVESAVAGTGAGASRFLDWTTGITWQRPAVSLAVSAGARAGDLRGDPWGQARLDAAVNARATLEATVGSYPQDVTGFTSGRFVTLGLRVGLVRSGGGDAVARALRIQRLKDGRARLTLEFADARSVAIAGDWNDWSPTPMAQTAAGRWTAVIRVQPGVHRYALLVDGTRWTVPQGAPRASDDFGGQAALLVLPDA